MNIQKYIKKQKGKYKFDSVKFIADFRREKFKDYNGKYHFATAYKKCFGNTLQF